MKAGFAIERKEQFVRNLLSWFASSMRPLPWRKTYAPYEVWISEIMLQQTRAERGAVYFASWMRRFPTIQSVAEAPERDILAAWEGLGYYSRARNLRAAAKRIMNEHGGVFPDTLAAIRGLPGVGEYSAGAIAAIAFNLPESAVDANVLRIFSRILDINRPAGDRETARSVARLTRSLIPADSPRDFCQALMELGALICGKTPKCGDCPVSSFCEAYRAGVQNSRPAAKPKKEFAAHEFAAAIIFWEKKILILQRPPTGLWAGMWEFPCGPLSPGESPEEAAARYAGEAVGVPVRIDGNVAVVRHVYTTNRVTLHGFLCSPKCPTIFAKSHGDGQWVSPSGLAKHPFPAGHRKLLERLGVKKASGALAGS